MTDAPLAAAPPAGGGGGGAQPEEAPKRRVLVVDDVEDNRDMLSRRLRRHGYEAVPVGDGKAALERLEQESFDIVLLDWMMPDMNGLEVLRAIRERHPKTRVPVLMATAKTDSASVVEALSAGANDHISKPIDFPVLLARLEAQLSMRDEAAAKKSAVIDARDGIRAGTVIDDRYEIEKKIGEGGFAAVYRATQLSTGQSVALKLLLPHRARRKTGDVELARFLREMRVIGEIRHPSVVNLLDSGQVEVLPASRPIESDLPPDATPTVAAAPISVSGTRTASQPGGDEIEAVPYIVMEHLEGEPLGVVIKRDKPLSVERACDIAIPTLAALGEAHTRGVIHRDVKPDNIMLARDHQGNVVPKVLDFGIAKMTEPGKDDLTKSDAFMGTPAYMSPEQGRGKKDIDGRSDQFSVGAILYHAVTGRKLYAGDSFLAMIHAVAAAEFKAPRDIGCSLPPAFETVLLKALSRFPDDRYPSAEAFALALVPFASERVQRRYADELKNDLELEETMADDSPLVPEQPHRGDDKTVDMSREEVSGPPPASNDDRVDLASTIPLTSSAPPPPSSPPQSTPSVERAAIEVQAPSRQMWPTLVVAIVLVVIAVVTAALMLS